MNLIQQFSIKIDTENSRFVFTSKNNISTSYTVSYFECNGDINNALEILEKSVKNNNPELFGTLTIPDIRNKLTPITTLIEMVERNEMELAKNAIKECKNSINYLAKREVYKK